MDFFDIIRELRTGEPNVSRAVKAMKALGWISILGGTWNFIILRFIAPFKEEIPFDLPPQYPYLALIVLLVIGILFFRSSRGIKELAPWGKKTGQVAVVLLIAFFCSFVFLAFPAKALPLQNITFSIVFILFALIFFVQLTVPAFFGVRYLGRLPVKEVGYQAYQYIQQEKSLKSSEKIGDCIQKVNYKESIFPFGILGTFALVVSIPVLTVFIGEKYAGIDFSPLLIIPLFLLVLLALCLYNYFPSSFQEKRVVIASFSGGGSIFLFQGSWPFFRLIVYNDGLEIRVMLHRFFIPYNRMDDIPDKVGFFNRGILIKSDLPDVPSGIRFNVAGMKKIVKVVNEARRNYMKGIENPEGKDCRTTA